MTKHKTRGDGEDDETFARAMAAAKVVPLSRDTADRLTPKPSIALPPVAASRPSRGGSDSDGGSDVDFAVDGVDRREIRNLKRGAYPPADRCDLHGLTAAAAREHVRHFVAASRRKRHRCICIVHGRGLRSPGGVSIVKARIRELLRSHPAVLAYADAPPSDGGSGAVYVLLRRG